jgi:hypothetical protein
MRTKESLQFIEDRGLDEIREAEQAPRPRSGRVVRWFENSSLRPAGQPASRNPEYLGGGPELVGRARLPQLHNF